MNSGGRKDTERIRLDKQFREIELIDCQWRNYQSLSDWCEEIYEIKELTTVDQKTDFR